MSLPGKLAVSGTAPQQPAHRRPARDPLPALPAAAGNGTAAAGVRRPFAAGCLRAGQAGTECGALAG